MPDAVLLYDAGCGFCRWATDTLLAWDRRQRLRPVALQDPEADRLLSAMSNEERMGSWHLVADGRIYSGGAAVPPLMGLLPAGAPFGLIASMLPGTTERLYGWVSRHRDQLGRRLGQRRCEIDPGARRSSGR